MGVQGMTIFIITAIPVAAAIIDLLYGGPRWY